MPPPMGAAGRGCVDDPIEGWGAGRGAACGAAATAGFGAGAGAAGFGAATVTATGFFGLSSQLSNGDTTWASFRQGSSDFEDGIYQFTSPDKGCDWVKHQGTYQK